ncbi:WhiB family transcriptional regulator [Streptomyces sp. NPDC051909]|uniref:WhiB family transcriptional regulator n=1 Tax=Streptomyces sp. NPDC051909 TaxID=3154944 RepID=UPI0034346888
MRDWRAAANCAVSGVDPEIFFPSAEFSRRGWDQRAKQVCYGCTVQRECFEAAMSQGTTDGVWGGLTGSERHALGGARPQRSRKARQFTTIE